MSWSKNVNRATRSSVRRPPARYSDMMQNPCSFDARVTPTARVHPAGVVVDSHIERSAIYVTRATIVTPFGAARR